MQWLHSSCSALRSTKYSTTGTFEVLGLGSQLGTSKMAENAGLDEEFKRIVTEMKPHARNLPQKSGYVDSSK